MLQDVIEGHAVKLTIDGFECTGVKLSDHLVTVKPSMLGLGWVGLDAGNVPIADVLFQPGGEAAVIRTDVHNAFCGRRNQVVNLGALTWPVRACHGRRQDRLSSP